MGRVKHHTRKEKEYGDMEYSGDIKEHKKHRHKWYKQVGSFAKSSGKWIGKEIDSHNPLELIKDNPITSTLIIGGVVVVGIIGVSMYMNNKK